MLVPLVRVVSLNVAVTVVSNGQERVDLRLRAVGRCMVNFDNVDEYV